MHSKSSEQKSMHPEHLDQRESKKSSAILWYDHPAEEWTQALPLGNGRLGAMIYGKPFEGHICLNEESMVYGGPIDRINKDAGKNLPIIRKLLKEGHIAEAEELEVYALSGTPQSQRPYQMLCDLNYSICHTEEAVTQYHRELNLQTGICKTSFLQGNTNYNMESLISKDEDLMIISISSSNPQGLSMSLLLTRGRFYSHTGKLDDQMIFLDGNLGDGGSNFCIAVKAVTDTGTVQVIGEHLVIRNAGQVILYINGVTTYPLRKKQINDCNTYLKKQLAPYSLEQYDAILKNHELSHREVYDRSVLTLTEKSTSKSVLPTDVQLQSRNTEDVDSLLELYYSYGRYLLSECSQPGGLPANLQGIWCEGITPTWDSKYTININTEMNYWPADMCNLSETAQPLFDHLERVAENGKRTAELMYGCRGFVCHHNTDVWADTAPQDLAKFATYWVMGGAWLCTHIWSHYQYTMDKDFLRRMLPILKEAVLFFSDYLSEDRGELVVSPSLSPENTYIRPDGQIGSICMGCTMDAAILRDLFSQYLKSCGILNEPIDPLQEKIAEMIPRLSPYRIGKYGQLMEWREDYEDWEPGHRHVSHLYGLFPSDQIDIQDTPELAAACRVSLERRIQNGGGHTGWSSAWLVNLLARLKDGDKALHYLEILLSDLSAPNLFDMHPPLSRISGIPWVFQIDGNFGGISGIAQMLLQSQKGKLRFLPALPNRWKKGSITGLKAEGGFILDIYWDENQLIKAELLSEAGEEVCICHEQGLKIICQGYEEIFDSRKECRFQTEKGKRYTILPLIDHR